MIFRTLLSILSVTAFVDCLAPSAVNSINRRVFLGGVAGGAAALVASPGISFADLPTEGKKAPDFELPNSRGNGVTTLDGLTKTSKWTVLYFYPGAFTSGCTLEARGFQRDLDEYRKLNAQIVGVSVDPVEKNAQFCSEEKLDFSKDFLGGKKIIASTFNREKTDGRNITLPQRSGVILKI